MPEDVWHTFNAPLELMYADASYVGLVVPADYECHLPFDRTPRIRVTGEMNGVPVDGTFVPLNKRRYIMVSKRLRKLIGAEIGDIVSFTFRIDDPDKVHTPEELEEIFRENEEARELWEALTPGKRRSLSYRFQRAKSAETRRRYADEVIDLLYGA